MDPRKYLLDEKATIYEILHLKKSEIENLNTDYFNIILKIPKMTFATFSFF